LDEDSRPCATAQSNCMNASASLGGSTPGLGAGGSLAGV
jgi:hypothetical protein